MVKGGCKNGVGVCRALVLGSRCYSIGGWHWSLEAQHGRQLHDKAVLECAGAVRAWRGTQLLRIV